MPVVQAMLCFISCHVIVFMPLTNPRSPRAVHNLPYCPLSGLILRDIPRHLTVELDYVHKCTCKMIFFHFIHFVCMCQRSCDM